MLVLDELLLLLGVVDLVHHLICSLSNASSTHIDIGIIHVHDWLVRTKAALGIGFRL